MGWTIETIKEHFDVMLRPEIEGRFNSMEKDIKGMNKIDDLAQGNHSGVRQGWALATGIVLFSIAVIGFLLK